MIMVWTGKGETLMNNLISKDEYKRMWDLYNNDKEGLIKEGTVDSCRYEISIMDAGWDDLMVTVDLFAYIASEPDEVAVAGICNYINPSYEGQCNDIESMLNSDILDAYENYDIVEGEY